MLHAPLSYHNGAKRFLRKQFRFSRKTTKSETNSHLIWRLTHSIWQIQLWCPRSKWNMGEIFSISGLKMMMKSGVGKIFLKFLHALTMSFLLLNFDQKYKFSNKNNMVSAWRNFKNIFPRPLFIIIFRPEMLKFHQCSILTGDTRVEFVIYCVLRTPWWITDFPILHNRNGK